MTRDSKHLISWAVAVALLSIAGCSDSTGPGPATRITNLIPDNDATEVPALVTLHWSPPNALVDSVTYDVYLGESRMPAQVASGIADMLYTTEPLEEDQTYYWRVTARNRDGVVGSSSMWKFRTTGAFVLPLAVGNRWSYNGILYTFNFEPDSIASLYHALYGDTVIWTSNATVTEPFVLEDSIHGLIVEKVRIEDFGRFESRVYMSNIRTGLYTYAYDGALVDPPKALPRSGYYRFHGMQFADIETLVRTLSGEEDFLQAATSPSLYREDPPTRDLAYPLHVGRKWVYRTDPWRMEKEVVGRAEVSTPAGNFDCLEIQYSWDLDGDGVWDTDIMGADFLSRSGYVKRFFEIHNVVYVSYDDPYGLSGYSYDVREEYTLTSMGR